MAEYQLFILPVIALFLVVLRNPFERDLTLSNSFRSRRYRRRLLGRLTVIVLLLATVITEFWPIQGMNSLLQGVLISALFLVPAIAVHWWLLRIQTKDHDRQTAKRWHKKQSEPATSKTAHDNEVQAQLANVSQHIRSHNLDQPTSGISPENDDVRRKLSKFRDQQVGNNSALVVSTEPAPDIATLDTPQIVQLVSTLRKDKHRLQKLVIAQQAALSDEQDAHDQTRILTRDAITIMRSSRTAQKHAEKLARRERSERQRVEQQYKKVANDLRNAMSIINQRKLDKANGKNLVE